jgi:S-adenosylmethionine decarboxylase
LGHHLLLSLYGVDFQLLNDLLGITLAFEKAVQATGATVLNRFSHQFSPQGVTVVYALSESHISIHTFPEEKTCAIDVYTCGTMDSVRGMQVLLDHFKPIRYTHKDIRR